MRLFPRFFAASAALLLAVVLASSSGVPARAEGNVIKLGCAISFTGELSRTGKLYRDAYDMAVERINAAGGVKVGDKNYDFKIVYYDDRSNPTESSRLVEKLLSEDKVNFLLGPYSSGITIPDSVVAERYRVPMIAGGGASGKIFDHGNRYVFGTLPPAGEYFKTTLEMMKTFSPAPKSIALIYADDKFDVSLAEGTKKLAEKMNFEMVLFEKYAEGNTDFTDLITKIKSLKADAVLVAGHSEEALNFSQQARELNVCPKMISLTVGPSEPDFRKSLGASAEYLFGVASWAPGMRHKGSLFKDNSEFVKLFEKKYGYAPDYHNASATAVVAVYKAAVEKAGTLDPEKVRDAVAAISLDTIYGRVEFRPNGQIKGSSVVLQIQDGRARQVYPGTFERKPVYPLPAWKDKQAPRESGKEPPKGEAK